MIRRLLQRFLAWLREPLYDPDDALDEYWQRKWDQEELREEEKERGTNQRG